jgi:hypothetical protein
MRDDFAPRTKQILADRAGNQCSNPECCQPTSGPQEDPNKAINIGVAAHITAAAEGGPRYDPSLTSDQRKSVSNGIWLCQKCAKLIDNDEARYTIEKILRWKALAENKAAEVLEKGPECATSKKPRELIVGEFHTASRSLMAWPRMIGDGKWIERGEGNLIIERVLSDETSTSLILGKPGSGKSALLAHLAIHFVNEGYATLSIKADMLPKSIDSLSSLQDHLELSSSILESISQLSGEKVILIFDQLDALSELVDRNSERLNVLLNVIKSASGLPGVHIVASCRRFEYQNDVRLNTLESEGIEMAPLPWEGVKDILSDSEIQADGLSDELRDLFGVPLHLKILTEIRSADTSAPIPTTLHALLEAIWQQRVLSGSNIDGKVGLIETMSLIMAEEEELWLARSITDDQNDTLKELLKVDILKTDHSGSRIGFAHQTYFDFARARTFASGSESISNFVIERMDGLFVRPILLRTIAYLRDVSPNTYARELQKLWETEGLRPHVRNLLIEHIGGTENPNEAELRCLLPLFQDDAYKYKALMVAAGSPGWFNALKGSTVPDIMRNCLDQPHLSIPFLKRALNFVEKTLKVVARSLGWFKAIKESSVSDITIDSPNQSHLLIPFLSRALNFAREDVLTLIENIWLCDSAYDETVLNTMIDLRDWNKRAVDTVCTIARRHESRWIEYLTEMVSQISPELAPLIVRADFDRRLERAIEEQASYEEPDPPSGEDEVEMAVYELRHSKRNIIDRVLRLGNNLHDLTIIAESSAKAFLTSIWPWFLDVIQRVAYEPHPFVTGFQDDHSSGTNPERGELRKEQPISAINSSIVAISKDDPDTFLDFFRANVDSPYVAVHRLLCNGLMNIVETRPQVVLEYLVSDPRRLAVGDMYDQHKHSKRLISAVIPHLNKDGVSALEDAVMNWNRYYSTDPKWSPEDRSNRMKWNREHRLRLLRAFPEELSSERLTSLRRKEERAFPKLPDWDSKLGVGGLVGSPMSGDQMQKAEDEHILKLFDDLTDETEWDHPKRRWGHIGGSVQASREFAAFAEKENIRAAAIISHFKPGEQERPAGMGISGLLKTDMPSNQVFDLIFDLHRRGFSSGEFRREVARGLQARARVDQGLPDDIMELLRAWHGEEDYPALEDNGADAEVKEEIEDSILWGYVGSFSLPSGRYVFIEAIALGYLLKEPPMHAEFAAFIEEMLINERHPRIWQCTMRYMRSLFSWDKDRIAGYYDSLLKAVPEVIARKLGILEFAKIMPAVPNKAMLQDWILQIGSSGCDICEQAYGELLVFYCLIHPDDEWGKEELHTILKDPQSIKKQRGAAFAASNNWHNHKHQTICTEIILALSSTSDRIAQKAISQLFLYGESVPLGKEMKAILEEIAKNDGILIQSSEQLVEGLIDNTEIEPGLIGHICSRIIEAGKEEIKNPGTRYSLVAEPIVSIAITLHRMSPPHREVGLSLFEQLIESDIPQARHALDILDRKPLITRTAMRRRRRRRKRK